MKIGYFCYRLSGTGPRTRAANVINGIAGRTDHEIVLLTNETDKINSEANVRNVSISNPVKTLLLTRSAFSDVDLVHVPINVYQVLFVRLVFHGPLVGGIGPGIQPSLYHRYLGRLLGIDVKIKGQGDDMRWEEVGYKTATCTATIDRNLFYPFEERHVQQLREERGIKQDQTVVLYIGKLTAGQGAHIVSEMADLAQDDDTIRFIIAGDGPLKDTFQDRDALSFEGFVDNDSTPQLYNIADVTVAPRKRDVTSNVGLESISCGTPMITTAEGKIVKIFRDQGTYVWANRNPEAVLQKIREITSNPQYYREQRERGFKAMREKELTLDSAIETHIRVYENLATQG